MSTSIIDGTITEADPGRSRRGMTLFKTIRFELADGSIRTLAKAVVSQAVADELKPGAKGRFYQFNAFDTRGIHGVRTPDGRAVYAFPANNEKLFLALGIINLVWVVTMLVLRGGIPLLGAALLVLCGAGWFFMNQGRGEAKRQFDGDAGYAGSAAAPAGP
jgi:hypothetical protein